MKSSSGYLILCWLMLAASASGATTNNTGLISPQSYTPGTTWLNPGNAYASDNSTANSKKDNDIVIYGSFNTALPDEAIITGIEIKAEWASGAHNKPSTLGVELSWDGGLSFTLTGNSDTRNDNAPDIISTFGGANSKWERESWSASNLTTNNFRVKLVALSAETGQGIDVDQIQARVYYTGIAPTVNQDGGATNISISSATLSGAVTQGTPSPFVSVLWGPNDGGTNKSNWTNSINLGMQSGSFSTNITGLVANKTYYYRCYASNFVDTVWGDVTTNFTTPPPVVAFKDATYTISEDGGSQTVSVSLDTPSAVPVSVNYATSNGTALAGTDYTATNNTLTWNAMETGIKTFSVPLINDSETEGDETIFLILSNAVQCTLGSSNSIIVITDNDGPPSISFASTTASGLESVTATNLLLSLSHTSSEQITVQYDAIGGTASNSVDYVLASGIATVEVGSTSAQIPLSIINDTIDESNETVIVQLSNPSNAVLGFYDTHTYMILDEDASPPTMDNIKGASNIRSTAAALRGEVTGTGGETPYVFVYWGPNDGLMDSGSWSNRISMGVMGMGDFSTNITSLVSNTLYYYRCCGSNSGGVAWAPESENFTALNPPEFKLLANSGFEVQGSSSTEAQYWTNTASVTRSTLNPKSGSNSIEFAAATSISVCGAGNNDFRLSWNGLYALSGTHPYGGLRPGFILNGTAQVRGGPKNPTLATFSYRLRNVDEASNWMGVQSNLSVNSYQMITMSEPSAMPAAKTGKRYRPELLRTAGAQDAYYADDLALTSFTPKLDLEYDPGTPFLFSPTLTTASVSTNFGVRSQGGASGTVLYGAYISNLSDLTNASWDCTAWYKNIDPSNAFDIVSGATLTATEGDGYHYANIRFTPPGAGTFTATVWVATTDPVDRYPGGNMIQNTIVYEEYTLVGTAVAPCTIGGAVLVDMNGDGIKDTADTNGVSGLTITLKDSLNATVATLVTDVNGAYSFTNLWPGTYTVVATTASGYHSTGDSQDGNDDQILLAVTAGQTADGNTFLDTRYAGISGGVFVDLNGNGAADTGDTNGISGVTVALATNGVVIATRSIDSAGTYSFTDLPPGNYTVVETNLSGYYSTFDSAAGNDDQISLTLTSGQDSTANNFLDTEYAGISGTVINDLDGDGIADPGENGIAGVTLALASNSVVITTCSTDGSGGYNFTNLPPGSFSIVETNGPGYYSTFDTTGGNDDQIALTLVSGQNTISNNFLDTAYSSISGGVYRDQNENGAKDPADTNGIAGVTINLCSNSTVIATRATDGTGSYSFTNLMVGSYSVDENDPAGYLSTGDSDGAGTTNSISLNLTTGGTDSIDNYFLDKQQPVTCRGTVYSLR